MGMARAHNSQMKLVRERYIRGKLAVAGDQGAILQPRYGAAHELCLLAHSCRDASFGNRIASGLLD